MLATEMFKVYRSMSPPIFSELFCRRDICHNLFTKEFQFCSAKCKICFSWKRKYFLLEPKVCDIVPLDLKDLTSLNAFKK